MEKYNAEYFIILNESAKWKHVKVKNKWPEN